MIIVTEFIECATAPEIERRMAEISAEHSLHTFVQREWGRFNYLMGATVFRRLYYQEGRTTLNIIITTTCPDSN